MRVALVAFLALTVAGPASAAPGKSRVVQVTKREGTIAATLKYSVRDDVTSEPTLALRRDGRSVLVHRLCPLDFAGRGRCGWVGPDTWSLMKHGHVAFRDVAPDGTPAVVVDLWTGGAHCCEQTFAALLGPKPTWIAHDWGNAAYRGERIGGLYYFVSGDNRFAYAFGPYAGSWFPAQIWTIKHDRLTDVTRSMPALVATNEQRAWMQYLGARHDSAEGRGLGVLAGWCADEFLLGRGARCEHVIRRTQTAGFVGKLNRDLASWGYKPR